MSLPIPQTDRHRAPPPSGGVPALRRYLETYGFSPDVVKPGITLPEIMEYSVSLGNYTMEEIERALAECPPHAAKREEATLLQRLRDGRVIAVMHRSMADGRSVATYEDITALKEREAELAVRKKTTIG